MREEFIIKVLSRASEVIQMDQVKLLRNIIEDELYNFELQPITRALVPYIGIPEKLLIYLASKKLDGLSKITLGTYKLHLTRFIKFVRKEIADIDAMDIRRYLAAYSQSGVKNTTIATEIWILKSFFGWLEKEDYIVKSPMLKIQSIKTEKRVRKSLTPEELEIIRDACKTLRERAMVEFFFSTGCRLDEICKLNKQDIDWNSDKCLVYGKGSKERYVFINAKAKVHMWKYLNSRIDNNEALFVTSKSPYERLGRRSFQVDFNDLGKRAGIKKNIHAHLMRHSMATALINSGATWSDVQQMLGHEDPSTTQVYVDINTEAIQQSHKRHLA
jgi:integrase/recombinase XerD